MTTVNGGVGRSVVQEYVDKPLLIGGYKSHLRLYAVITSTAPLRVYIYADGVLQLASEKYLTPATANLVSLSLHVSTDVIDRNFAWRGLRIESAPSLVE